MSVCVTVFAGIFDRIAAWNGFGRYEKEAEAGVGVVHSAVRLILHGWL